VGAVSLKKTFSRFIANSFSEERLIRETCSNGNIDEWRVRLYQKILRTFNPSLHQPFVSRYTQGNFERPGEVADRKTTLPCQLREPYSPGHILVKQFRCTALLPRR